MLVRESSVQLIRYSLDTYVRYSTYLMWYDKNIKILRISNLEFLAYPIATADAANPPTIPFKASE